MQHSETVNKVTNFNKLKQMKAKEFIQSVNRCSIFWSNIERRYVITAKGKQLYDTNDLDGAIDFVKGVLHYAL